MSLQFWQRWLTKEFHIVGAAVALAFAVIFLAVAAVSQSGESAALLNLPYENRVYVDVVHSGNLSVPKDTIFIGGEYRLRIWMENDFLLQAFGLGFHAWSDYGEFLTWAPQANGLGINDATTLAQDCRMASGGASDGSCWDLGGVITVFQEGIWVSSPLYTFFLEGCSMEGGLEPGLLEPMMYVHFRTTTDSWEPGMVGTICVDSGQVSPPTMYAQAYWGYSDWAIPEANVPRCWPVRIKCGDPNGDGSVDVMDVVFMINYIFRGGPGPDPWQLGDANSDGTITVGDAIFLLKAAFRFGPQPECPP